ncbi:hypothetical protein V8B97DRAFT_1914439 [Scleroderma yunnanense]
MSALGSVFLGDVGQRHRVLASSPPPSSPPPHAGNAMSMALASAKSLEETLESVDDTDSPEKTSASLPEGGEPGHPSAPASIDPALSLELRIRWLEALLLGVRQDARERKGKDKLSDLKAGETLVRLTENVQHRLNAVVESNDGLKKFMSQYDHYDHLLTPAFAYSGTSSPALTPSNDQNISPEELEALLAEMEPDIRAADRDMREIELLVQKGILGAGKLTDYEALQPRLQTLLAAQEEDRVLAASLEKRIAVLVNRHATHVDALSELFVAWDDILSDTESKIRKLERERMEKHKLGYE